jgi:hypothetical protein
LLTCGDYLPIPGGKAHAEIGSVRATQAVGMASDTNGEHAQAAMWSIDPTTMMVGDAQILDPLPGYLAAGAGEIDGDRAVGASYITATDKLITAAQLWVRRGTTWEPIALAPLGEVTGYDPVFAAVGISGNLVIGVWNELAVLWTLADDGTPGPPRQLGGEWRYAEAYAIRGYTILGMGMAAPDSFGHALVWTVESDGSIRSNEIVVSGWQLSLLALNDDGWIAGSAHSMERPADNHAILLVPM